MGLVAGSARQSKMRDQHICREGEVQLIGGSLRARKDEGKDRELRRLKREFEVLNGRKERGPLLEAAFQAFSWRPGWWRSAGEWEPYARRT